MPNTSPPIATAYDAVLYKKSVERHMPGVEVLTSIKFLPTTTPQIIKEAALAGVEAVKLYPQGVTTNSQDGISVETLTNLPEWFLDCLDAIRKMGMTLCLHGEMPGCEVLKRESAFLEFVYYLCMNFPKLRIVLEHISTREQVHTVRMLAKRSKTDIAATITAHHLILTLDDVIGDKIHPHHFCKPVPKMVADRDALREAAMGGEPYFFLGSDSAPHMPTEKECEAGCAGVYSAPVLVECLTGLFDEYGSMSKLPNFMYGYGTDYYKIVDKDIQMKRYNKVQWQVPYRVDGVRPFMAGNKLEWISE